MKEDVLEQLVDDYLQLQGYFTRHNIKFRPSKSHADYDGKKDCVYSDMDIIGFNPQKRGHEQVVVVSCKSWQGGFNVPWLISALKNGKKISGKDAWKTFREIMIPKWSEGFLDKIHQITGKRTFTYITAVTLLKGDRRLWETYPPFCKALKGNPLKIVDLKEILESLERTPTTTPAGSSIGRILQLIRASKKGDKALVEALSTEIEEENSV